MRASFSPVRRAPPVPPSAGRRSAFTLIELLTVIAIIGILAAIVIASVGAVRKSAARADTMAKMRGIGLAVQLYIEDNKGVFPGRLRGYQTPVRNNRNQLVWHIEKYLGEPVMQDAYTPNPRYLSSGYRSWLERNGHGPDTYTAVDAYVMWNNHDASDGARHHPWGEVDKALDPMRQTVFNGLFPPSRTRAMEEAQGGRSGAPNRSPARGELYRGQNMLYFDWHVALAPSG